MGERGGTPGGGRTGVAGCGEGSVDRQRAAVGFSKTTRTEAEEKEEMSGPTPRRLLGFVTRRLRLRRYLEDPGDGRPQPQIPARRLVWALLVGQILRQCSFHALEALVRSPARRNLALSAEFSEDALGYFSERLHAGPTRQALLSIVRRAKRNKAFENSGWIGLAIDGTGAGWRTQQGCALCRPKRNAQQQILGYQHFFVLASVVGTGLTLPLDVEPLWAGRQRVCRWTTVAAAGDRWSGKTLCAIRGGGWGIFYCALPTHGR